jgi:predicted nucleic acid-binding protein
MKVFLDTNVLVSAVVKQHVFHERAFTVLDRVHSGKDEGFVSAHSLAEMYSVLTNLPAPYRHTPEQALLSIEENVLKHFKTVALIGTEYASLVRDAAKSQIQGGKIYDALLLKAADKAAADRIYTLNLKHFLSIASSETSGKLSEP